MFARLTGWMTLLARSAASSRLAGSPARARRAGVPSPRPGALGGAGSWPVA